jgi:hypothetical protein
MNIVSGFDCKQRIARRGGGVWGLKGLWRKKKDRRQKTEEDSSGERKVVEKAAAAAFR